MKSKRILSAVVAITASVSAVQAADYVKTYTTGSGSQLLSANGGSGAVLFVDEATTGGGDMTADGGNPTWGWEVDGSASWGLGDKVEFTGIAMPIWANDPTTDATGNTQNATHRIRIYSCGANNSFDGTVTDALIDTVDVTFGLADSGIDEYYVNFDTPVEWTSADSTKFYFYIQAIELSPGSGMAMRFKTGAPSATTVIKNRTNGANQTVSGSTTTSLSVAGSVNKVERTWFGDNENVISNGSADWDTSSFFWDASTAIYADGEFAIFDDTFDGLSNQVNLVGSLSPGLVVVSNAAIGLVPEYVFTGSGGLTGVTGVVKSGDGLLTIENTGTNDYAGGTLIEEGTLALGRADALSTAGFLSLGSGSGTAELRMNGFDQAVFGLANPGSNTRRVVNGSPTPVVFTISDGGTYNSQIGNTAVAATDDDNNLSVVKTGAGELNLVGGNNSYSGTTTINGGTVRIGADNGLGSAPLSPVAGAIVLDGGTLRVHMAFGTGGSFAIDANRSMTLGAGGGEIQTTTPSGAWAVTYNGVISGSGSLTKSSGQALELGGANTYGGDTILTGGTLRVNGGALPDGSALTINNGKVESTGTEVVDSLFFGATQQVTGTWGAAGSGATNIDGARFAGTAGVVSVTNGPSNPYLPWAATNITAIEPGAPAGFGDDADGDGLGNGLEWILGGDPLASDPSGVLPVVTGDVAGGLTLVFDRAADSVSSSTLRVEWDTTLPGWANSVLIDVDIAPSGDNPTVTIVGDEVTVNIPGANATTGNLFARLIATQP